MKKGLKLLFAILAISATAAPMLHAQDDKTPPPEGRRRGGRGMPSPEQRVAEIDKAVTLTADQKTQALDILTKAQKDIEALPQEERREKGRDILKSAHDQIRALLTDDQKAKFDAMPAPGRRGPGGPGGERRKKDQ